VNFTGRDWFSRHIPVWESAFRPFFGKPTAYLEIGVYEGRSFCWMLEHLLTHPESRAIGIDIFEHPGTEETFRANVTELGADHKVTLLVGSSRAMLRQVPFDSIDVIYIDGAHRAASVLEDTILAWPLLKHSGVLMWDDYWWVTPPDTMDSPKFAIDTWMNANRMEFLPIWIGSQAFIQKIPMEVVK
jgi:predicted O-methyltransferase YrrM